jgi:hypothetical protein
MTTIPCPFCNSPIPIDSTICVRCGKQGGERLERVRNAVIEEEAKAAELEANARSEIERQNHDRQIRRKINKARLAKVKNFLLSSRGERISIKARLAKVKNFLLSSRGKWISVFVLFALLVVGTPQVLRQPVVLLNLCGTNGITATRGATTSLQAPSGIRYFEASFSSTSQAETFEQCVDAWSGILGVNARLPTLSTPVVRITLP